MVASEMGNNASDSGSLIVDRIAPNAPDAAMLSNSSKMQSVVRIEALDWIRGFAALWVVFYHIEITLQKEKYFGLDLSSFLTASGFRGVDIFFVLSGFVMTALLARTNGPRGKNIALFTLRRLFRIFPLYIPVFCALYVVIIVTGAGAPPSFEPTASFFATNLFLLPRDDLTSFIPVSAWTLSHELMFYAVCIAGFFSLRFFVLLLFFWTTLCLCAFVAGGAPQGWSMQFSIMNGYFFLGALAAILSSMWKIRYRTLMTFSGLLCVLLAICLELQILHSPRPAIYASLLYAIGFFLIVLAMSQLEAKRNAVFSTLGDISYSVYILNYPLVTLLAMLIARFDRSIFSALIFALLSILLTIVLSMVSYKYVEKPGMMWGRKIADRYFK
jgi:exopolysaccharide production protein ExoZ